MGRTRSHIDSPRQRKWIKGQHPEILSIAERRRRSKDEHKKKGRKTEHGLHSHRQRKEGSLHVKEGTESGNGGKMDDDKKRTEKEE